MAGEKHQDLIQRLQQFVAQKGWSIADEKKIAHGNQLLISDGLHTVPVALYATGKILIQGKESSLRTALKNWDIQRQQATVSPAIASQSQALFQVPPIATTELTPSAHIDTTGLARIGSDESGKGDFFGPLVVASVYVDQQTEPHLLKLGVRDSKKLTDKVMSTMVKEIMALCPHSILTYQPEQYNQRYQMLANLNVMLAQAHAQVISKTVRTTSATLAIVDQFGDESLVRKALHDIGCPLQLEQRHRAEEDTAVAAASIVARAVFVHYLRILSRQVGIDLPKGASNPRIVEIGRTIVAQHGQDALRRVAKLHFKTAEDILHPHI